MHITTINKISSPKSFFLDIVLYYTKGRKRTLTTIPGTTRHFSSKNTLQLLIQNVKLLCLKAKSRNVKQNVWLTPNFVFELPDRHDHEFFKTLFEATLCIYFYLSP